MYHEYIDVMVQNGAQLPSQAFVGNGPPYLVGRLSYGFGWTGPCVSTDTACSSSLVAAHLAQKVSIGTSNHVHRIKLLAEQMLDKPAIPEDHCLQWSKCLNQSS